MSSVTSVRTDNTQSLNWTDKTQLSQIRLLVGSASAVRREIASEMGFGFIGYCSAQIDERAYGSRLFGAEALVTELGKAKASSIISSISRNDVGFPAVDEYDILLTADQVIVYENKILEKPRNRNEAIDMLSAYRTTTDVPAIVKTVGSIILTDIRTSKQVCGIDVSAIQLYPPLTNEEIHKLVDTNDDCYNSSGALCIETPIIISHVKLVDGSMASFRGLSKEITAKLFDELHLCVKAS